MKVEAQAEVIDGDQKMCQSNFNFESDVEIELDHTNEVSDEISIETDMIDVQSHDSEQSDFESEELESSEIEEVRGILIEENAATIKDISHHPKKTYNKKFLQYYNLKFWNDSNSCYCNSIVQAVLSLNNKYLSRVSK
jgi:hypothetical protein